MDAVVVGNATLDVICYPVDEVPRYDSISFDRSIVSPGGCGSNAAVGLCSLGVSTALVAVLGDDDAAFLVERFWQRLGLDQRFIQRYSGTQTGTSIGLLDSQRQPRFVHSMGANSLLCAEDLPIEAIIAAGARALHIAGYFVLPGLLNPALPSRLAKARRAGIHTSLDVVDSPHMVDPSTLWPCLPELDVFLCNAVEAGRITGHLDALQAAKDLRRRGANAVVVKLGAEGCWLESESCSQLIPGLPSVVVDTTGAGDAFCAGLVAGILRGEDLPQACSSGNHAGRRMVSALGAVAGWFVPEEEKD